MTEPTPARGRHRRLRKRKLPEIPAEDKERLLALFSGPTKSAVTMICKKCSASMGGLDRDDTVVILWTNATSERVTADAQYEVTCDGCHRTYHRRGAELLAVAKADPGSTHRMR